MTETELALWRTRLSRLVCYSVLAFEHASQGSEWLADNLGEKSKRGETQAQR